MAPAGTQGGAIWLDSAARGRGRDLQSPFHGIRVEASTTLALAERAAALQKRVKAGLKGLQANWWITTSDGYRYRADLAFPEAKVAIEYQSNYHRSPEQFRADMTRSSRLQADGWTVVQINADDLRSPEELVRRIRRYLAAAART